MPHGYCTGCHARVTVRDGNCLLGHPIDTSTIRFDSGRRRNGRRSHAKQSRRTSHRPKPEPQATTVEEAPDPTPTQSQPARPQRPARAERRHPSSTSVISASISPTSELVAHLWTNAGEATAVENWRPQEVALDDRKTRPARVTILLIAISVATVAAWWTTIGQEAFAAGQASSVRAEGRSLEAALAGIEFVAQDMADGRVDDRTTAAMALAALDRHARALFDAASDLPADGSSLTRLLAVEAAEGALEVERIIGDTTAYQTGFETVSQLPEFPSAVALEDVPSVAGDTSWWIAEFREAVAALPTASGLAAHHDSAAALAVALDGWQTTYLDALAAGDQSAAEAQLTVLSDNLAMLRQQLGERLTDVSTTAVSGLKALRQDLGELSRGG